jgi:hypothetical protein
MTAPSADPAPKSALARFTGDSMVALAIIVFTIAYLAIDYGYKPALRNVPALVGWITLVLATLDLASHSDNAVGQFLQRRLNPPVERVAYPLGRQLAAMGWVAGFAFALVEIGVVYAVPLFVVAFMRLQGQRPLWVSVIGGAGVMLVVWLLFSVLLRLPLYGGALFGGG